MSSMALAVASAGATVLGGVQQASALKTEAVMLERQATQEKVRGKQISAERRAQLKEALSTISATQAARGLSVDSPTSLAIRGAQRRQGEAVENADVLTSKQRETGIRAQAAARRRAAPWAILGSLGQGAATLSAARNAAKALGGGAG